MANLSGYQPLAQSAEEEDVGEVLPPPATTSTSRKRRAARPGHIDLSKLDNAFKRWTESIAQKMKRKKKVDDRSRKEILRSVFEPHVILTVPSAGPIKTLDHKPPMTRTEFDILEQAVRDTIVEGIHPKMITKGSSGSYFARAKVDGRVSTVAVFKPKDEEPYGRLNPKTTKWLHRQLRWIIPFGRSCLIPNLSYISEAAASLLDRRLHLHIVPRTELVSLSSPAFFYDWLDRNAAKKGKPLPAKIGSMQCFLHGFLDASDFLRKHPWPGRAISDTFDDSNHRQGGVSKKLLAAIQVICGKTGEDEDMYDDAEQEDERALFDVTEDNDSGRPFYWTLALQQSFREELEKLVILDYLMLNTDRGADNYMIKYCEGEHEKSLVDVAPSRSARLEMPLMSELRKSEGGSTPTLTNSPLPNVSALGSATPPQSRPTQPSSCYNRQPHIHIAAIDNSLSFPHEHPQGWRSYTYGWLYLPVSIIGRPFSEKIRNHFLPLLTSKQWWEETTFQLRNLFAVDPDFHPQMFRRQLAVMKGQAFNIVQSLRHSDEGPLELTRRTRVLVWDDEIEVPTDESLRDAANSPTASPPASVASVPLPRTRSFSAAAEFPPPMRRTSMEAPRPVPFSAKFQRVHPGTTGVTVLEHLERLDAVEASLQRLGIDDTMPESPQEVDVGESSRAPVVVVNPATPVAATSPKMSALPFSPVGSPDGLPAVPEVDSSAVSVYEDDEEDVVAMSKSTSHMEGAPRRWQGHSRWGTDPRSRPGIGIDAGLDWIQPEDGEVPKRTVIVERMEVVAKKPLCGW